MNDLEATNELMKALIDATMAHAGNPPRVAVIGGAFVAALTAIGLEVDSRVPEMVGKLLLARP